MRYYSKFDNVAQALAADDLAFPHVSLIIDNDELIILSGNMGIGIGAQIKYVDGKLALAMKNFVLDQSRLDSGKLS